MRTTLSYFICTTPRTGSFLLAEALEGTGIAGRPQEYFESSLENLWMERLGIASEPEYFEKVMEEGTTSNGVFGAKLFWFQFQYLLTKLDRTFGRSESNPSLLNESFPNLRFVLLTRRDKVRQAISYVRAIQSDVWWSIPGESETQPTPKQEPIFDREEIESRVAHLIYLEANWRRYFEERGIRPLTIVYEEMIDALEPAVSAVLHELGLPIPEGLTVPSPRLAKQSDQLTELWVRRYLEHD